MVGSEKWGLVASLESGDGAGGWRELAFQMLESLGERRGAGGVGRRRSAVGQKSGTDGGLGVQGGAAEASDGQERESRQDAVAGLGEG